jgi:transcription factor SFP1
MMMSGTSPFAFQSPSYHSSSYLPKLEANFMKDFSCCGLTLPTLHDLLQHYEESHAQKDPLQQDALQPQLPDTRAALAATTATQVQQEAQQRYQQAQLQNAPSRIAPSIPHHQQQSQRAGFSSTLQTIPDMDTVEDMEMDDMDTTNETTPPPNFYTNNAATTSPQSPFAAVQQTQVPQLNTSMMQGHQAYRQSAPSTPLAPNRNSAFHANNTSSTLSANPMQQFQDLQNPYRNTPDSSAPGTPGELDESVMAGMDDMSMQQNALFSGLPDGFGNFGFGTNSDMIDLCIDEPAKRLFQQARNQPGQNPAHQRLGSGQYGANSDIARTIRERQIQAGLPDTTTNIMPHEEPKPFRCPVIGCEKAYKNQNGLKYHKSVGRVFFCLMKRRLTFASMVIITSGCTRTVMARFRLSTQILKHPTPALKVWRRRSHTNATCVRNDTKT